MSFTELTTKGIVPCGILQLTAAGKVSVSDYFPDTTRIESFWLTLKYDCFSVQSVFQYYTSFLVGTEILVGSLRTIHQQKNRQRKTCFSLTMADQHG